MNLSLPLITRKIADYLAGRSTTPLAPDIQARLTPPWTDYYQYILNNILASPGQQDHYLAWFTSFLSQRDEREMLNLAAITRAIDNPPDYRSALAILDQLPDYTWLWQDWLPQSLWTLLAGAPGTGKSYLAQAIAQIVCQGDEFPNGVTVPPGRVLWVDAENRPAINKQRFAVWPAADLENLYLFIPRPDRGYIHLDQPDDQATLLDMLWSINPALLIVDSFGSASSRGENSKEDIHPSVAFYNQIALEFGLSLLLIHHLNKPAQASYLPMSLDRVRGSTHLVSMASIVWGMQWIPTSEQADPNGPRLFWHLKNNIARHPDKLGVQLVPHPANRDVAQVKFVEPPDPYQKPSKRQTCAEWLLDLLSDGKPRKSSEIFQLADEHPENYSRSTVYKAKQELAELIINTIPDNPHAPENCWTLAD
jgi:putative DNA primase/helicase